MPIEATEENKNIAKGGFCKFLLVFLVFVVFCVLLVVFERVFLVFLVFVDVFWCFSRFCRCFCLSILVVSCRSSCLRNIARFLGVLLVAVLLDF